MSANIYTPGLRAALHRALPTPFAPANLTSTLARTRLPATALPPQLTRSRPFTTTSPNRRKKTTLPFGAVNKTASPSTPDDPMPANPHIDAPAVMIAEPGKGLKGPFLTTKVIRSLNPATHTLRVVAAGDGQMPICRIFDLRAEEEQRVLREAKEKENEKKKNKYKILEVGWGIAENDLQMKMERMRRFLEDGCRVELVLMKKRGGRRGVVVENGDELVARVKEAIGRVEGAKEAKNSEGEVGRQLKLFVEKVEKKA